MSALVAIPVHERPALVRRCLATVADLQLPEGGRVVLFDDCTQSFSPAEMAVELGVVADHERQPFRIGADAMIYLIWSVFLFGTDEYLLILDSDMIANTRALTDGIALVQHYDGLLSLYNSIRHPVRRIAGELAYKDRLGNAGTLWTRALVSLVRAGLDAGNYLDDRYSFFLRQKGISLAATTRSRVQHLGLEGKNNRYFGEIDHGAGFVPDSPSQWQGVLQTYDDLMTRQHHFLGR